MMICHDNVYCFVDSFSGEHDTYSVQNIKRMYLYVWLLVSRQTHSNDFTINLSADVFSAVLAFPWIWPSTGDAISLSRLLMGTQMVHCGVRLVLHRTRVTNFSPDWVWSENAEAKRPTERTNGKSGEADGAERTLATRIKAMQPTQLR